MKFTAVALTTALLAATTTLASPAADPEPHKALHRAQRFNNWCIGPGQMCYKNKRDLDSAIGDVLDGYYAPDPSEIAENLNKREANAEPHKPLHRAQRFNNWCIGPGQMCYKNKRDLEEAADHVINGYYAPDPEAFEN